MTFDTRGSGALTISNFKKFLRFLGLEATKIAIKGLFNTYGSWEGEEEAVYHQLNISDFTNLFRTNLLKNSDTEHIPSYFNQTRRSKEFVMTIINKIIQQELDLQDKINEFKCKIKFNLDFMSILKIFGFSNKWQYITKKNLKKFIEVQTRKCLTNQEMNWLISRTFKDMELWDEYSIIDLVLQIFESENREELRKMALSLIPSETMAPHKDLEFEFFK